MTRPTKDTEHGEPKRRARRTTTIGVPRFGKGTRRDVSDQAAAATVTVRGAPAARDEQLVAVAHDLRNPLSNIVMDLALLREVLGGHTAPIVQRSLQRLEHNTAFMEAVLAELLDQAQVDSGALRLQAEPVDLAQLLTSAVARIASTSDTRRLVLETQAPATSRVDRVRIERVIENLIRNALKYAPGSSVTIRLAARATRACISISDRGPGLTVDQARHVFERNWRASGATPGGFGLGLYVSRKIVEAHGGRIGVESAPGKGCRFFFDLPLHH